MIIKVKRKKFLPVKVNRFHSVLVMYVFFFEISQYFIDPNLFFVKYVVKTLMGSVDSWFDQLDEVKVSVDGFGRSELTTNSHQDDYKSTRLFPIFIFYTCTSILLLGSSLR